MDAVAHLNLPFFHSLSEFSYSSILCWIPNDELNTLKDNCFVDKFISSSKDNQCSPIVIRSFSKNYIDNCRFIDTSFKENENNYLFSSFENNIELLVLPFDFKLDNEINNIIKENDFYYNWRRRCLCKIKIIFSTSSSFRNQKIRFENDIESWKHGETLIGISNSSIISNLQFPDVREVRIRDLPFSTFQESIESESYKDINELLNKNNENTSSSSQIIWIAHHPSIVEIQKVSTGENVDYLFFNFEEFTLDSIFTFSRNSFNSDIIKLFLVYQLLRVLLFSHSQGMIHGNIKPSNILSSKSLWLKLTGYNLPKSVPYLTKEELNNLHLDRHQGTLFTLWRRNELSNYDYLMALNSMAKRRLGDPNFCPVLPWVTDFTSRRGKLRDLTKTKYRLNKGDEQLDYMFASDNKHHITDCLSDLTYYSYKARRTSVDLLKKYVRAKYEPKEFPASMERLYQVTPDECIPEFYTDPTIFKSIHNDMPDLKIPSWANSEEDFINQHRKILECPSISENLHYWIDLTFGYKLTGKEAEIAKNVAIMESNIPRSHGFVQLFTVPHPPKQKTSSTKERPLSTSFKTDWKKSQVKQRTHTLGDITLPNIRNINKTPVQIFDELIQFEREYKSSTPCYKISKPLEDPIYLTKNEKLMASDIYGLGCVISEIYQSKPLFNVCTITEYENGEYFPNLSNIPKYLRKYVKLMIDKYPSNRIPLNDILNSGIFPSYFEDVYAFLVAYHSYDTKKQQFQLFQNNFQMIEALHKDGFKLLLPYILPFFTLVETQSKAIYLLEPIIRKLGSKKAHDILSSIILNLYEKKHPDIQYFLLSFECVSMLQRNLGLNFIFNLFPFLFEGLRETTLLAEKSSNTLTHLGKRIPLALTVQKIIYPLLNQLKKSNNSKTVELLLAFVQRVGSQIVEQHYIPQIMTLIKTHSTKASQGEQVVLSCLTLIEGLLPDLATKAVLKGFVIDSSQLMVLLLNATTSKILYTLIGTLVKIAYHIGPDSTTEKLVPYLDQFFSQYEHVYPQDSTRIDEIYTAEMAAMLYYQFAILIGKDRLDNEISNVKQIQSVMKQDIRLNMYYENLSSDDFIPVHPKQVKKPEPVPLKVKLERAHQELTSKEDNKLKNPSQDPNWLYNIICESSPQNTWNGTLYHSQKAHSGIIKAIDVNDFESSVVTSSYDNTVKLWSIDNNLRYKFSYSQHKKPVHSVCFVNKGNFIASCDQILHVWDPRTQQRILNLSHKNNFKGVQCVSDSNLLAVSTHANHFCFVDIRCGKIVNEWIAPVQTIRGFTISPNNNYVILGNETGLLTALDYRTGILLNQWKAHDSLILKMDEAEKYFVSSSTDKTVCKWDLTNICDPQLLLKLKGYHEPVANFAYMGGSLLTASSSKVAIVSLHQETGIMQVNPTKLINSKSDRITAMKPLPFHRLFVLGTEDGYLKVCA